MHGCNWDDVATACMERALRYFHLVVWWRGSEQMVTADGGAVRSADTGLTTVDRAHGACEGWDLTVMVVAHCVIAVQYLTVGLIR